MLGFNSCPTLCHPQDDTWGVYQRAEPTEAPRCPEGLVTPWTAGLTGLAPYRNPLNPGMWGRQLSP